MVYRRFQDGFEFVEYDLLYNTTFIQNCIYMNFFFKFDTVLYQFLETGTSDRCLRCIVQRLRDSQVSFYTPFHFSFTVLLYSVFCVFIMQCYQESLIESNSRFAIRAVFDIAKVFCHFHQMEHGDNSFYGFSSRNLAYSGSSPGTSLIGVLFQEPCL